MGRLVVALPVADRTLPCDATEMLMLDEGGFPLFWIGCVGWWTSGRPSGQGPANKTCRGDDDDAPALPRTCRGVGGDDWRHHRSNWPRGPEHAVAAVLGPDNSAEREAWQREEASFGRGATARRLPRRHCTTPSPPSVTLLLFFVSLLFAFRRRSCRWLSPCWGHVGAVSCVPTPAASVVHRSETNTCGRGHRRQGGSSRWGKNGVWGGGLI